MADPFKFKYIQPSFQEIFKTAAPTSQQKSEPNDNFYANFEDIMKEQGGKKKK